MVLQVIRAMPLDLLREISPESIQIYNYAKVPLVITLLVAAFMLGLELIFLKFAQQVFADANFKDNHLLCFVLIIASGGLILSNLHWVNLAVKFYDQTDVIPIYQAFSMVSEILVGLIIGDEFKLYTSSSLGGLLISSVITLGGVAVLATKSSQMKLGSESAADTVEIEMKMIEN